MVKVVTSFVQSMEIDTVYYDPAKVTPKEMKDALKKADTYISTIAN